MYGRARDFMHGATFMEDISTVKQAADIMAEKNIGSVLVGEPDYLKGIVTERDILKKIISKGLDPSNTNLGQIMTSSVVTVEADADIHRILGKFSKNSIRRLPVLDESKVVGILTIRDITASFIPEFFRNHPTFQDIKEYTKTG